MTELRTQSRLAEGAPLVFLHLPKTAGTTFRHILDQHYDADAICPAELQREFVHLDPRTLERYRIFRGHYFYRAMERLLPERPVYITLLRDPIERTLSNYAFLQNRPRPDVHTWETGLDLEAFLFHPWNSESANRQTRMLASELDFVEPDNLPEALDRERARATEGWYPSAHEAISVLAQLDVVGIVERFGDSMALLAHELGWPPLDAVPRMNVSPRRPLRQRLPQPLLDRLIELNQEDLQLYAYAKQLFEDRYRAAMIPDPSGGASTASGGMSQR